MYNTAKASTPARPTAPRPAAAKAASTGGSKPGASLSIGVKNGESVDFHDLTGLFDATDKKGRGYFRVSVKEEIYLPKGATVYLRTNDSLSAATTRLSFGVGDNGEKMKFTDISELATASDKSGKNYFRADVTADTVIPAGSLLFAHPKTK